MINLNNIDIFTIAKLYSINPIFEEKQEYTKKIENIPMNSLYVFKDEEEFKNYFRKYGLDEDSIEYLNLNMNNIVAKNGVVFAFKIFCDYAIKYYKWENKLKEINTPKKLVKKAIKKQKAKVIKKILNEE